MRANSLRLPRVSYSHVSNESQNNVSTLILSSLQKTNKQTMTSIFVKESTINMTIVSGRQKSIPSKSQQSCHGKLYRSSPHCSAIDNTNSFMHTSTGLGTLLLSLTQPCPCRYSEPLFPQQIMYKLSHFGWGGGGRDGGEKRERESHILASRVREHLMYWQPYERERELERERERE